MIAPDPPFLGRRDELRALESAMPDTNTASPRLIWVNGPIGIGKTLLVRRFLEAATEHTLLWATADETERSEPFAVLRRLLCNPPPALKDTSSRLIKSLRSPAAARNSHVPLRQILGASASERALIVVLDNLQWADSDSLLTLRSAVAQLGPARVLVLGLERSMEDECWSTNDSAENTTSVSAWAQLASNIDAASTLTIRGFSAPEIGNLAANLRKPLSAAAARRLAEHTGGNPMHATALLQELDHTVLTRGWGALPAPAGLTANVSDRLCRRSEPCQSLVRAAAVLGCCAPLESAASLAGLSEPFGPLTEAVRFRLLREVIGMLKPEISFPEPLVRAAVYWSIDPQERRGMHRRAIEVTQGDEKTRNWVAAVAGDGVEAGPVATKLGQMAYHERVHGSCLAAASYFDWAAELTSQPHATATYLRAGAEAYLIIGDAIAAEARMEEADRLQTEESTELLRGQIHLLRGEATAAQQCLEFVKARPLGDEPDQASEAGEALNTLAVSRGQSHQVTDSVNADLGVRMSGRGEAAYTMSVCFALGGRTREALAAVSAGLADGCVDEGVSLARGVLRLWMDELRGAQDDFNEVLRRRGGSSGHFNPSNYALTLMADLEYRAGAWGDALAHAELAAEDAEDDGRAWHAAVAHSVAVPPLLGRGDLQRAEAHVRAAEELARGTPIELVVACTARARAASEIAAGDLGAALRAIVSAEQACDPIEPAFFGDGPLRASILAALGWLDEAEEALEVFASRSRAASRTSALAQTARARACLERHRGRPEVAAAALADGLALLGELAVPFEEARLRLDYGRVLAELDLRVPAIEQLTLAATLLTDLGARPYLQVCKGHLATLRAGPTALDTILTRAELEVAQMVALGLSNLEVAARRVVSLKTVEAQLTSVYRKLRVTSRNGLVSRLELSPSLGPGLETWPPTTRGTAVRVEDQGRRSGSTLMRGGTFRSKTSRRQYP